MNPTKKLDMMLNPEIRRGYIETLIKLIELNSDHEWLEYFRNLRTGGSLPGGGAGSLNDWEPSYNETKTDAWYGQLYDIIRVLFDNNAIPDQIDQLTKSDDKNQIRVIRCLRCEQSYQHPGIFEQHLATRYYHNNLVFFAKGHRLTDILKPELSFNSKPVLEYRKWLLEQYAMHHITVYDFVFAGYICPHCNYVDPETKHDIYHIVSTNSEDIKVRIERTNS